MEIALRRKKESSDSAKKPRKATVAPRNQTGAAAPIRGEVAVGWSAWRFGASKWQEEAWRHYDRCPELHNSANQIAVSASRAIIQIVDKVNGEPGQRAKDKRVAALSDQLLGGADERPEMIRQAVLNNFVAGEYYVYVETPADARDSSADRWMVLSVKQVRPVGGMPKVEIERPMKWGGGKITHWINEGRDKSLDAARAGENTGLLTRSWTPHGLLPDHPDSSVRASIPVLNIIEQFDKRTTAQNDSRLAGAGVLLVPETFDFPAEPGQDPVEAFEARIGAAMGQTIKDQGNARSLVPIIASALPAEDIKEVRWLTFETPLDEQAVGRLDQCIRRLALGLDLPPELLLGQGGVNHWSGWLVESSTQKTFIAPPLARLCHALNEGVVGPTLEAMGINPDEYMVWFDLAPLVVRPDRQADGVAMWDRGLINDQAMRRAGNWTEDDAHTAESYRTWLISRAISANPQMLLDPNFAGRLGIQVTPPAAASGGQTAIEGGASNQQPPERRTPAQEALVAGAEMAALHSLGVAGKKMLTRAVRDQLMNEFSGRTYDLHTRVSPESMDHAVTLLDGTWDLLPQLSARTGVHPQILQDTLQFYCASQMLAGSPHNPDMLVFYLSQGIEAAGHRMCTHAGCVNQASPVTCSRPVAVPA